MCHNVSVIAKSTKSKGRIPWAVADLELIVRSPSRKRCLRPPVRHSALTQECYRPCRRVSFPGIFRVGQIVAQIRTTSPRALMGWCSRSTAMGGSRRYHIR